MTLNLIVVVKCNYLYGRLSAAQGLLVLSPRMSYIIALQESHLIIFPSGRQQKDSETYRV